MPEKPYHYPVGEEVGKVMGFLVKGFFFFFFIVDREVGRMQRRNNLLSVDSAAKDLYTVSH